jgi:hypothetical protein
MFDYMAQRYGCLPSAILKNGDVFDLHVIETVAAYERYQQDRQRLEQGQQPLDNAILEQMMNKVKGA